MIRNKTLHAAARMLLGAFIAAYAMSSVHVYARVAEIGGPQPASATHHGAAPETAPQAGLDAHADVAHAQTGSPVVAAAATAGEAAEVLEMESHCQPKVVDPAIMLCKFHCQNAVQTLDHPGSALAELPPASALMVPLADLTLPRKPLVDKAFRPEAAHHGGAPPLYSSTARLRI